MKIREAKITDAAALARVSIETWRSAYAELLPNEFFESFTVDQRTRRWIDRLSDPEPSRFTLVAETPAGEVVGYAGGLSERTGNTVYTGELGDIYVLEEYQRRGVGRRLMVEVVKRLVEQGHDSLLVWAFTANPYRSFYETLGGEKVDTKDTEIAGVLLPETAYGWRDLSVFTEIHKKI